MNSLGSSAPKHIAIIMDGNGRWAKERGLSRTDGHQQGARNVRQVVHACHKRGVEYLTLFSFSTENWKRPEEEVGSLMKLFALYLDKEIRDIMDSNIRLKAIGDFSKLPFAVRTALKKAIALTSKNTGITLVLAISYGGREEIVAAVKKISESVVRGEKKIQDIEIEDVSSALWTSDLPDPDLLIRTSGEQRISNFLLWQLAYSEIYICQKKWPEFGEEDLDLALKAYASRERRFGLSGEQLQSASQASS